jgi:RNA polymerase sigma-70 factor (ECF subfamily)
MDNKQDIYISLINEYRDRIVRICFAYLDNRSYIEDIYQDILLAIWTGLERFRHESGYGTWIYRITVNTIFLFNKNERKRKRELSSASISHTTVSEIETKIQEEENLKNLYEAISGFEEFERILIGLYLEKISYKEIGSILGISTNLVGVKLNRIKYKIRKQLKIE